MDKLYNSAMTYMANAGLTLSELTSYEAEVEGYLLDIAEENTTGTDVFLMLSNEVPILSASYGEQTFVVLSLINLGKTDITDVVITPTVSNNRTEWPFDIEQAYDAQCIQILQASDSTEDAYEKRMDIGWTFTVRADALTGCYPLTFHASYYQNGAAVETDIVTYINITGADPDKTLIDYGDDDDKLASNPRIIVTGFTTDPETVYAGSTFMLTISVKNTSAETTVKNVLFDLEATVEGSDSTASYAAFLPTSGSSSVYAASIAPNETYEISIEMEAKSDLSQKPYVLTVNMKYDTDDQVNLSDNANVSIPIKQESKLETSSFDVLPESFEVGDQSNVMFSVYNTGKTTLYNVKVSFRSDGGTVDEALTYLGNITAGSTGSVDAMVTGTAPDETGEGIVYAVISYEDESGNVTEVEKEFNLYVYEMSYDDFDVDYTYDDYYIEEETGQQGVPVAAIIAGCAAAAVIVIIVVIVIVRKRRRAKRQKEDLELLDDEQDGDDL